MVINMLKVGENLKNLIKIKKIRNNAIIPKRATNGSAGLDLSACIEKSIEIHPGEILKVPTGIAIQICDNNYFAMICARSGLGINHGITLSNGVGIVDSDYRGEICVGLINLSKEVYNINPGQRIAQMLIMPVSICDVEEVSELDETVRGKNGFGSTGK